MTGGIRGRKVGDKSPITKNLFLIKSVQYSSSLKRAGVIAKIICIFDSKATLGKFFYEISTVTPGCRLDSCTSTESST